MRTFSSLSILVLYYLLFINISDKIIFCVILIKADKPRTVEDIDKLISAELPDKTKYPQAYETVLHNMVHGPCGRINPKCPCMVKNEITKITNCSKQFPKPFASATVINANGYPTYQRRQIKLNEFVRLLLLYYS